MKQGLENRRRDETLVPGKILRLKKSFPIDLRRGKASSKTINFSLLQLLL